MATIGPATAAAIGPVEAVIAPAGVAIAVDTAAAIAVVEAIEEEAAAAIADRIRGDSVERRVSLIVAPSALAL